MKIFGLDIDESAFAAMDGSARQTTPQYPLSKAVRRHCTELCRSNKPVFLPFTQKDVRYPAGFCHVNAIHAAEHHGGKRVSGWIVWEMPALGFVEGEFHSVWEMPDGQLVDVTPRADGESEVLFLRDGRRRLEHVDGSDLVYSNRLNCELGLGLPDRYAVDRNLLFQSVLDELDYPPDQSVADFVAT